MFSFQAVSWCGRATYIYHTPHGRYTVEHQALEFFSTRGSRLLEGAEIVAFLRSARASDRNALVLGYRAADDVVERGCTGFFFLGRALVARMRRKSGVRSLHEDRPACGVALHE